MTLLLFIAIVLFLRESINQSVIQALTAMSSRIIVELGLNKYMKYRGSYVTRAPLYQQQNFLPKFWKPKPFFLEMTQ